MLRLEFESERIAIMCVSETWLREGDSEHEFSISGYDIYTQDRHRHIAY